MLQPKPAPSIDQIVADIRRSRDRLAQIVEPLRTVVKTLDESSKEPKLSAKHWVAAAHTDAVVRVRLLTEQNFIVIETLGVLATARYLFELVVWLKLMNWDERYGLVYYYELCRKMLRHHEDLRNHLLREISFLRELAAEEDRRTRDRLDRKDFGTVAKVQPLIQDLQEIMDSVDDRLDRSFTLYGDDARTRGYGYQAFLVESQALPTAEEAVATLREEFHLFETLPRDIRDLFPKGREEWRWREKATLVDIQHEYDFIYTFASRLLHATPASLSTDQKNLEQAEMKVFLQYCRVRIHDIIEMATKILRKYPQPSSDQPLVS